MDGGSTSSLRRQAPIGAEREPDNVRNVADEVVASLTDREGMFLVEVEDGLGSARLLDAIGRRLPAGFRWSRVRGPQRASLVWTTLLETAAAGTREGRMSLSNCLRERAQGGVWTVLAVDEADRVPAEVFEMLDEVAGLEPMLQVVLIGREGFLDTSRYAEATRLRLRVRRSKTLRVEPSTEAQTIDQGTVEHIPVESAPVETLRVEAAAAEPNLADPPSEDARQRADAPPARQAHDDEAEPSLVSLLEQPGTHPPGPQAASATAPPRVADGSVNGTRRPRDHWTRPRTSSPAAGRSRAPTWCTSLPAQDSASC